MQQTFLAQIYEHLKEKDIVVFYQPKDVNKTDLEFLGIPFKKYEGDILEDMAYTTTLAVREKYVAFIICAAMHPVSDIHARYSKANGMIMLTGAKQLMSKEIPYLTEDTQVPITWEIEERVTDSGQPYLALEGTCQLMLSDTYVIDEFKEFMESWVDFPIITFEESHLS